MKVEVVTITPERAAEILARNPKNRNLRSHHVEMIARDIKRGDWQCNGDAIRLNGDGSLIDGQHRLSACIKAGIPITTIVVSGLPGSVRDTIDSGAKRTIGDRFAMRGMTSAKTVASAIRYMTAIANGTGNASAHLTASEAERIVSKHPGISESVYKARNAFPGCDGMLAAIHYIGTATGNGYAADQFLKVWATGVPEYEGDPAHVLREKVIRLRGSSDSITSRSLLPLMLNAWRNFSAGKSMKIVRPAQEIGIAGWSKSCLGLEEQTATEA